MHTYLQIKVQVGINLRNEQEFKRQNIENSLKKAIVCNICRNCVSFDKVLPKN